MTIIPATNYPVVTGYSPAETSLTAQNQAKRDQTAAQQDSERNAAASQLFDPALLAQRVRRTPQVQNRLDQNLTHQGATARELYLGIEQLNETELMPRLNITV